MSLIGLRKVLWLLAGAATSVFIGLLLWLNAGNDRAPNESKPPFFADFELTDHRGMVRTEQDYAGSWMLIFFGFTNCPDICPTTLSEVATVMEGLGDKATKVQPIFISIDPERDTPTALSEYLTLFEASIVGLTGTAQQIVEMSEVFPIFYERIEQAAAPDGYTMSHTSHLMLFDQQAGFEVSWPYGTPTEEIVADLRERI